jgi:hypothetical protein
LRELTVGEVLNDAVAAVSREAAEWYAINWRAINRNVRRLQVRIVQATKASRWGRVRALQRLLMHSYSGNDNPGRGCGKEEMPKK